MQTASAPATRRARIRTAPARSSSPLFDELAATIPASTRPLSPILPESSTTVAGVMLRLLDDDTKATRRWPFHSVQ